jgi:GWxTD domain-containing protein
MKPILFALFIAVMLAGCSSSKNPQSQTADNRARQTAKTNTAKTETTRTNDPRTASSPNTRPANGAAPVRQNSATSPSSSNNPATPAAQTWTITSIKGKFLVVDSAVVRVYLNITGLRPDGTELVNTNELTEHFLVNYVVYPDYSSRERLAYGNVPLTVEHLTRIGSENYLTISFDLKRPAAVENGVLLTEMTETNTGKKALNDLPIRFKTNKMSDRFALFDAKSGLPQLRNYAHAGDTILLRDAVGTKKTLFAFRYKHEFEAASSPMNTASRPAAKTLSVDSTMTLTSNQPFVLPGQGLYFFLEDTTETYGMGVVVADRRFPKMTRPEKLIKPVLYMSTGTEINELNQAKDAKKALDRYWLSLLAGNEEVARRTIHTFYDRVEDANRLFTSYKEGWKTDKGMVFIILGAPDRVQRSRDREVWVYNRRANVSEINFTFNRKPNQFVEDHYELVRYAEYQPIWYPIVEAWRTGAIRE